MTRPLDSGTSAGFRREREVDVLIPTRNRGRARVDAGRAGRAGLRVLWRRGERPVRRRPELGSPGRSDRACLLAAGGFDCWTRLPPDHQGEDAAAQFAVMRRFGGAGIVPSGAYHLESPATVTERGIEAWSSL